MSADSLPRRLLLVVAILFLTVGASAKAERIVRQSVATRELSSAELIHSCALIAHVRIAGKVEFREGQTSYFAEVLDAAAGPPRGDLVLLANDARYDVDPLDCEVGQQLIVFAGRDAGGVYCPLPGEQGEWAIDKHGSLAEHASLSSLVPPQVSRTPAGVIAHLANECRSRDIRVTVKLNDHDLRRFEPDRPLRVEVAVENTGELAMELQNDIDYEFHTPHLEMLEAMVESSHPRVKIYLQPLGRMHQLRALSEQLRRLNRPIELIPGERCEGEYDLAEQGDISGGGRFQLWAEVGGRRSNCVVLDLPKSDHALEAMAKLDEAWDGEDGGPLRKVAVNRSGATNMPLVTPTLEAEIVNAVLTDWCGQGEKKFRPRYLRGAAADAKNVVLLRPQLLPPGFAADVPGTHVVLADPWIRDESESVTLSTSAGTAVFGGVVLQIDEITIDGQTATVRISQNRRHNLGGSGATYQLRRVDGRWKILFVPERWVS